MYKIAKNSKIYYLLGKKEFKIYVNIKYGEDFSNSINLEDVKDLRDRAYLIIYS